LNVLSTQLTSNENSSYTNGHAIDVNQDTATQMIDLLINSTNSDGGIIAGYFNTRDAEKGL